MFYWEKGIVLENEVCAVAETALPLGPQNALMSSLRSENPAVGLATFEP